MVYTGHKNKAMDNGQNIVDWIMPILIQDSSLFGNIPIPSREQIALVIRAMRMHPLLEYASKYDFSELSKPDEITKFFPTISSIGRFLRDAPEDVLNEYEMEQQERKDRMTTTLSKEAFIKLAEAYSKQENYEKSLKNEIGQVAGYYNVCTSSVGLPSVSDLIMGAVLDLLGYDFIYYFYDCGEDFNKFNKNILLEEGKHPNVNNFGELWEFSQKYGIGIK